MKNLLNNYKKKNGIIRRKILVIKTNILKKTFEDFYFVNIFKTKMQSYNWGQMLVRYAAGGDIAGVKNALASGDKSLGFHVGEAYWVATSKGHQSIMVLISSRYNIPDTDQSTARRYAKQNGHSDCVTQVDGVTTKTYGDGRIVVNIFYNK